MPPWPDGFRPSSEACGPEALAVTLQGLGCATPRYADVTRYLMTRPMAPVEGGGGLCLSRGVDEEGGMAAVQVSGAVSERSRPITDMSRT